MDGGKRAADGRNGTSSIGGSISGGGGSGRSSSPNPHYKVVSLDGSAIGDCTRAADR